MSRLANRVTVAAGAGVGLAAASVLERAHLRRIARDPELARLSAPLGGRARTVVSADGTRLHAQTLSEGDAGSPVLVLIHGWTERSTFWGPVAGELRGRPLRVVAFDLRGHGESEPARSGEYALERFGEDVEAVLRALAPAGRRLIVAGHSLGAMAIVAWAQDRDPQGRLHAAALLNTGLGDLVTAQLLFGQLAQRLYAPSLGRLALGWRGPLLPFSTPIQHAVVRHAAFGPDATFGQVAFYERMLMQTPARVRAATGLAIAEMDLWEAAERFTAPTLVLAGEEDRLTPPVHARRIADSLPQASLVVLPRTGHMAPLERPREVAERIAQLAFHRSRH